MESEAADTHFRDKQTKLIKLCVKSFCGSDMISYKTKTDMTISLTCTVGF